MAKLLITSEVAKALRISEDYARHLIRTGAIKGYREGRRGGFRVDESEIDNYINRKMKDEKNKIEKNTCQNKS